MEVQDTKHVEKESCDTSGHLTGLVSFVRKCAGLLITASIVLLLNDHLTKMTKF